MPKRVIAIGDFHCGHRAGLTPESYISSTGSMARYAPLQVEMWRRYLQLVKRLSPVYAVFLNGDLIDGRGERSGSTELIEVDRTVQAEMAAQCALPWKPEAGYVMTYGTDYHTGQVEDFERLTAEKIGAEIHNHAFPEVDGVTFDLRHHVGSSSVPHGRHTAIARERLWNVLWSEHQRVPRAQVVLRSHVHYHGGAFGPDWLGMTLPALQAAATRYGSRRCSGTVDWGVTWFDIEGGEIIRWKAETIILQEEACHAVKL